MIKNTDKVAGTHLYQFLPPALSASRAGKKGRESSRVSAHMTKNPQLYQWKYWFIALNGSLSRPVGQKLNLKWVVTCQYL